MLHPFLQHYQTFDPATGECSSEGSIGDPAGQWNAANGSSSGWQQFQINIPGDLGPQVEISITSVSVRRTTASCPRSKGCWPMNA